MIASSIRQDKTATARWIILILLAVALVVQIGYALTNHAPPIWDETGHTRAANALQNIHSLSEVPDAIRASLRYGLIYPLWLATIYSIAGENFFLARMLQGVIAVATLGLLFLAAREMDGKRASLLTLALSVLYLPFVATAARLLSETLAVFWLALALWLIVRGFKRNDALTLFFAGIVTVLAGLTRPTLQMMFLALTIGLFAALWLSKQPLRRGFSFAAGVLILVIPFLILTRVTIGRATLSGSVSPFEGIFIGNYIPDGGYPTDARSFLHEYPQPEFDQVYAEHRAPKDMDFARVTLQGAERDPLDFLLLQARKLYDQWRAPFNDFQIDFAVPYAFQESIHALIILLGAIGALAFWKRQPMTIVLTVGWLYIIATNLIVPVERRYAFPGIPFALILAGASLDQIIAIGMRRKPMNRMLLAAVVIVVTAAIALFAIYQSSKPSQDRIALSDSSAEISFALPANADQFTDGSLYVDGMNVSENAVRAQQNDQPVRMAPAKNLMFENSTYATLLERRGLVSQNVPQWFRFDFDLRAFQSNSDLRVFIDAPAIVTRDSASQSRVVLPALDSFEPNNNTSLYKYLADGDYRIPRAYSVDANSSDSPYRVLLVLERADGTQEILW